MTKNNVTKQELYSLPANVSAWANQLKRLVSIQGTLMEAQRPEWELCGHAVLLEVDEPDTALVMAREVAMKAGMELLEITVADVVAAADGWLQVIASDTQSIVYLTPGAWMGGDSTPDFLMGEEPGVVDDEACRRFREKLAAFLLDDVHSHPVVLVTGVGCLEMLHVSLRRLGLFDRRIKVAPPTDVQLTEEFVRAVGLDHLGHSLLSDPNRLASLLRYEYPQRRRRALMQKALRRQAWAEGRTVELADLLRCAAYGTSECDSAVVSIDVLWSHAIHEAGHAVLEHLDSSEKMPPSYCSILTGLESLGVVVANVESVEIKSNSALWRDVMHRLRAGLGGRAAEQVVLGLENLSAVGSRTDLAGATKLARQIVAVWGLPLGGDSLTQCAENLAVWVDEPSPIELAQVDQRVRQLLQDQYGKTVSILERHKDYLVRIAKALMQRSVLLQEDFEELWREVNCGVPVEPGTGLVKFSSDPASGPTAKDLPTSSATRDRRPPADAAQRREDAIPAMEAPRGVQVSTTCSLSSGL